MNHKRLNRRVPAQLTVRGFDAELGAELVKLARRKGLSLNKAALLLMRQGAGLEPRDREVPDVVGDSLDDLIGTWSADDERQVLDAIEPFERIDEAFWS